MRDVCRVVDADSDADNEQGARDGVHGEVCKRKKGKVNTINPMQKKWRVNIINPVQLETPIGI